MTTECVAATDTCGCRDCQADYARERATTAACRCENCGDCADRHRWGL